MSDKKKLREKIDRTALITEMLAASKQASDRWAEVCRVYSTAWDAAFEGHMGALAKVKGIKEAREKAQAERLKTCFELATVFLPIVGGAAAFAMAPILSTRGKFFASVMEKKASAAWKTLATSNPITAQVLKQIGEHSAGEAKSAVERIQDQIIDRLNPKYEAQEPPAKTPIDAMTDKNNIILDRMNGWVKDCATWNRAGGWQQEIVPVAHALYLNHPWVSSAPEIQKTQGIREPLTKFIEIALWLRWARSLDERYWKRINDWYYDDYQKATNDMRGVQITGRAKQDAIAALDFRFVWERIQAVYPNTRGVFQKMVIRNPEGGLFQPEYETINLYQLYKTAKNHHATVYALGRLLPANSLPYDLSRELLKV